MEGPRNMLEACFCGLDWIPRDDPNFLPMRHPPGSPARIQELTRRIDEGLPLWHTEDVDGYDHLSEEEARANAPVRGEIKPRKKTK